MLDRDVSLYFSLSYANYLVWPRLFMEDMPADWQARFCELADEYNARFDGISGPRYEVNLLARAPELITLSETACPECDEKGIIVDEDGDEEECPTCDGTGLDQSDAALEHRYETPEEVGRRQDWRSDYRHGQRVLADKLAEAEANRK